MEFRPLKALDDRTRSASNRQSKAERFAVQKPSTSLTMHLNSLDKIRLNSLDNASKQLANSSSRTGGSNSTSVANMTSPMTKRAEKRTKKREASEELSQIDQSNSQLRKSIKEIKTTIRHKFESIDSTMSTAHEMNYSRRNRMDNTVKTLNLIQHNKQTFFNFTPSTYRPVAESSWNKAIHMTPRLQRTYNSNSSWIEKPKKVYRPGRINFSTMIDTVFVQPSYIYCRTCSAGGQRIELNPKSTGINREQDNLVSFPS